MRRGRRFRKQSSQTPVAVHCMNRPCRTESPAPAKSRHCVPGCHEWSRWDRRFLRQSGLVYKDQGLAQRVNSLPATSPDSGGGTAPHSRNAPSMFHVGRSMFDYQGTLNSPPQTEYFPLTSLNHGGDVHHRLQPMKKTPLDSSFLTSGYVRHYHRSDTSHKRSWENWIDDGSTARRPRRRLLTMGAFTTVLTACGVGLAWYF